MTSCLLFRLGAVDGIEKQLEGAVRLRAELRREADSDDFAPAVAHVGHSKVVGDVFLAGELPVGNYFFSSSSPTRVTAKTWTDFF